MSADCIFCQIAAGRIPCTRVHEDEVCLAFMDINPISPGHTLIIPKRHYTYVMEMPPDEVGHIGSLVPRLAGAVKGALGAEGINLLENNGPSAGQVVMHVHFHLIPRWPGDGLGFRWPARKADPEVLKAQAEKIKAGLK
jgi:histidine triad (HIT) family protein